jgi:peptide deformylase
MVLPIVKYGHPVLRQKGAKIDALTPEIHQLVADMLETMAKAHGVGLAAQQIGRALQLAVVDVRGVEDRPSTLERDGQPADVDAFMPLLLINPEIKPLNDAVAGPEGCLSFPELYADIARPEQIEVTTTDAEGRRVTFRCGGLLSRAIQHETDHLNGILFIDRMDTLKKREMQPELDDLQAATKKALAKGKV